MIALDDLYKQNQVYLHKGKLYRVLSYCVEPSVTMVPIEGEHREDHINFGISGFTSAEFKPIPNLRYNHDKEKLEVTKDG